MPNIMKIQQCFLKFTAKNVGDVFLRHTVVPPTPPLLFQDAILSCM